MMMKGSGVRLYRRVVGVESKIFRFDGATFSNLNYYFKYFYIN
jgi:hypothetical protein